MEAQRFLTVAEKALEQKFNVFGMISKFLVRPKGEEIQIGLSEFRYTHMPFLGWLPFLLTAPIFWQVWLILSIYYAIQAYNGKTFSIPIVSDFAKKYAAA